MEPTTASITETLSLLPLRDQEDLAERLTRLARALRDAPINQDSKALFDAAARALSELSEQPLMPDRVMCLLFVARYAYYAGNVHAALEPASQAVVLAERLGDPALRAKALKSLGNIYLETGPYPDTVSTFTAAFEAVRAAGDRTQEIEILSNLGLAHQYAGHFSAALPCYERAVALADRASGTAAARATALGNLVLARLHLRQFEAALQAARAAVAALELPETSHERALRSMAECYYVRALLETGHLAQARRRTALARDFAGSFEDSGPLFISQVYAEMAQGLVDVHDAATRDIGLSRLQRAVDQSRRGAPTALRDALAMMVRGYEIAGQPNTALVYLHEVARLNGAKRVHNVLLHHRLHLNKLRRHLDHQARAVIERHQEELRFQRVSMDVFQEYVLVLEKATVAAELHDDETGEHCYRVGALARELARRQGMDEEMCRLIDLSARMHDIGKLQVPDSILLKPGRLDPAERSLMQQHCVHGWELIGQGGLAQLFVAQEIALNHHERWDGGGYPNGRSGSLIPLAARITALADVFDALTHRRCYKQAWTVDEALGEIARLRGSHFDPELTDAFLALVQSLRAEHRDLDRCLGAEAPKNDFIADRERLARELKRSFGTYDASR